MQFYSHHLKKSFQRLFYQTSLCLFGWTKFLTTQLNETQRRTEKWIFLLAKLFLFWPKLKAEKLLSAQNSLSRAHQHKRVAQAGTFSWMKSFVVCLQTRESVFALSSCKIVLFFSFTFGDDDDAKALELESDKNNSNMCFTHFCNSICQGIWGDWFREKVASESFFWDKFKIILGTASRDERNVIWLMVFLSSLNLSDRQISLIIVALLTTVWIWHLIKFVYESSFNGKSIKQKKK